MIGCYRSVLATPGAGAFTAAGLLVRLPMTMVTLGVLLLVHERTGSYAIAGAVTAASGVAFAIASPVLGRLVDRLGQARVLLPTVLVHACAMLLLVGACLARVPVWNLFVIAAFSGATAPSIGTLLRARWSHVLNTSGKVHTAYALESSLDELMFLIGPALINILAVATSPALGLTMATLATASGSLWLCRQRSTAPPPHRRREERASLRAPGVFVVALVLTAVGALCGSISILVTAFARADGFVLATGPLISMWALGSVVSALWYGTRQWRAPLQRRFMLSVALLAIGVLPLALAGSLWAMGAAMFVAGLSIAPTLITGYSLASTLVPAAQRTQGLALAGMGSSLSAAAAAATAGYLVDTYGLSTAFTVSVLAGPLALLVAVCGRRWLSLAPALHAVPAPRAGALPGSDPVAALTSAA